MLLCRKSVSDHHRGGRVRQPLFDLVETQDAIDRRDIQGAVPIGDAHRHLQAAGDCQHFISALIAVSVHYGVDVAFVLGTDKQRAVLPKCHATRIWNIVRVDRDDKTRGKLNLVQRERGRVDLARDE